ncbi:FmdB family zinc ribbon protein [Sphingomonas aerophila]|uniref:FmdB family zinc ribbon protein n=1 Tax=Sphingomonas aerophila TaxID=1344948 RepID=UPI003CCD035A
MRRTPTGTSTHATMAGPRWCSRPPPEQPVWRSGAHPPLRRRPLHPLAERYAMPLYDYDCTACGPFTALRPMALFRDPCDCPACGADAPRALLGAPALAGMDQTRRDPPGSKEPHASSDRSPKAAHPAGCGCCARRSPFPGALASKGRVFASSGPLGRGR